MTADDLPAAFASVPPAWRRALRGWTPAAEQGVIDGIRRASGDRGIGPDDPFRALRLVSPDAVKVIIVGQDPYPTPGQADGLCFSAERVAPRASLRRIFEVLEADRPGWKRPVSGRLDGWAAQGVLLLNTALTVEWGLPGSHLEVGWRALTCELASVAIGMNPDIVVLAWGRHAVDFADAAVAESGVPADQARVLRDRHPSNDYQRAFMAQGSHFAKTCDRVNWWAP